MKKRFAAAALLVWAALAAAQSAPPSLRADQQRDGSVRVRWSIDGDVPRSRLGLEIQRAMDGGDWATVVQIDRPRRRAGWRDDTASGTASYRARVLVDDVGGAWTDAVTLAVQPGDPGAGSGDPGVGDPDCGAGVSAAVVRLVNAARRAAGVPALSLQSQLDDAADARAAALAAAGTLSHAGWVTTIRAAGYDGGLLGENIAFGYATADDVVGAWLSSPGHRANILNPYFTDVGIGCTRDDAGVTWWAQDFGG